MNRHYYNLNLYQENHNLEFEFPYDTPFKVQAQRKKNTWCFHEKQHSL